MGALENITQRIKKDASQKAQKKINEAKKEAKEILERAQKELDREKKTLELETDKIIKIQRSRAISEGKLEGRKMMLNAKEEIITNAFTLANQRLAELDQAQKEGYLGSAIKSAVSELGSDVTAFCNQKDKALVTKVAKQVDSKIKVSSEGIEYIGGVVVRANDGSAQIDATFEGLLNRMRNDLRREIAEILFTQKQADKKDK
jgi:V/A-type H+-transporting ATPase subunit E